MKVQWLLIGGSMNGQTHWADNTAQLHMPRENGATETYLGLTYHMWGKRYRIGVTRTADAVPSRIEQALIKAQPQHFGEV